MDYRAPPSGFPEALAGTWRAFEARRADSAEANLVVATVSAVARAFRGGDGGFRGGDGGFRGGFGGGFRR